jgi:hypothetical protein
MRLMVGDSALEVWMFASGCGNERVGDQGILRSSLKQFSSDTFKESPYVNTICNGIPSFSAQCMCAKLGGFAMITSATNGLDSVAGS